MHWRCAALCKDLTLAGLSATTQSNAKLAANLQENREKFAESIQQTRKIEPLIEQLDNFVSLEKQRTVALENEASAVQRLVQHIQNQTSQHTKHIHEHVQSKSKQGQMVMDRLITIESAHANKISGNHACFDRLCCSISYR